MGKTTRATVRTLPRVALLVETSLGSGRDILKGIAQYMGERGPWSIYHEPGSLADEVPGWVRKWDGDGIIARLGGHRAARAVKKSGLPVVDVLGVAGDPSVPLVHVDDEAVADTAAAHLLSLGLRHFAYCGMAGTNWSLRRGRRFAAVVRQAGHDCAHYAWTEARDGEAGWEQAQEHLVDWLCRLPKPVGIMVCSDQRGVAVLDACRRGGIAVPEQAAVVGVDDDDALCSVCDPPLTSVIPNHQELGYRAAQLLDRMMRGHAWDGRPCLVQPVGVATRRSTDTLAVDDMAVLKALHFVRNHAFEGVSVDEVAKAAGLSRSVLQRRFRRALGRTVHDELIACRVQRAMKLLAESDIPISEVAEISGFKHQEYLGVVFKSRTGRTPAMYRRESSRKGHQAV